MVSRYFYLLINFNFLGAIDFITKYNQNYSKIFKTYNNP